MDRTRHCHGNHIFLKTLTILVQITPLLFNEFFSYSLSKTVALRTGLSFGRIMLRLAVLLFAYLLCVLCLFVCFRLVKIKEWIDTNDPGATIIPISAALELALFDMGDEDKEKYLAEKKTTR